MATGVHKLVEFNIYRFPSGRSKLGLSLRVPRRQVVIPLFRVWYIAGSRSASRHTDMGSINNYGYNNVTKIGIIQAERGAYTALRLREREW